MLGFWVRGGTCLVLAGLDVDAGETLVNLLRVIVLTSTLENLLNRRLSSVGHFQVEVGHPDVELFRLLANVDGADRTLRHLADGGTAVVLITSGSSNYTTVNPFVDPQNSLPLYVFTQVRSGQPNAIVRAFGADMVRAADSVAAGWPDDCEIDLDAECRRVTLRALGRSVLGLDQDGHADFFHLRQRRPGEQLPEWYDQLGSFSLDTILSHEDDIPAIRDGYVREIKSPLILQPGQRQTDQKLLH